MQFVVVVAATVGTFVIFVVESTTTMLAEVNPIGHETKEYGLYGILILLLVERWAEMAKGNAKKITELELQLNRMNAELTELKTQKAVHMKSISRLEQLLLKSKKPTGSD